jgi:hypothetical protein
MQLMRRSADADLFISSQMRVFHLMRKCEDLTENLKCGDTAVTPLCSAHEKRPRIW